jgi:hypothetical protein
LGAGAYDAVAGQQKAGVVAAGKFAALDRDERSARQQGIEGLS